MKYTYTVRKIETAELGPGRWLRYGEKNRVGDIRCSPERAPETVKAGDTIVFVPDPNLEYADKYWRPESCEVNAAMEKIIDIIKTAGMPESAEPPFKPRFFMIHPVIKRVAPKLAVF